MLYTLKKAVSWMDKKRIHNIIVLFLVIIAYSLLSMIPVYYIQKLIDAIDMQNQANAIQEIILFGFIYLLLQISGQALGALSNLLTEKIQTSLRSHLQMKLYQTFLSSDISNHKDSTALANRLIEDTKYISTNLIKAMNILLTSIFTFCVGVYLMMNINVYLTLIIFPLGLITALSSRKIEKKMEIYAEEKRNVEERLWKCFAQGILGAFTLKLYDQKQTYFEKMKKTSNLVSHVHMKQSRLESMSECVVGSLYMITIGCIMIFSAVFVTKGMISIGGLTALLMYNHMLVDPLMNLLDARKMMILCNVSMKRMDEFNHFDIQERIISNKIIDMVVFQHVAFWYQDHPCIINDLNITLRNDSIYLIRGRSGIGKTTFVNLLAGLIQTKRGEIVYVNNHESVDALPDVAYLMQNGYLFDMCIKENIKIANPDITDKEYRDLIDTCCLNEIQQRFGNQAIGENGQLLSGGERKRILLAQTLARTNCHIMIFDELSNSLDQTVYRTICKNMRPYLKNKICIFIEHHDQLEFDYDYEIRFQEGNIQVIPNKKVT